MSLLSAFRSRIPFPLEDEEQLSEFANRVIASDSIPGWIMRRGLLVHRCSSSIEYVRSLSEFDNEPYVEQITIPTLLAKAEGAELAGQSQMVHDRLTNCKSKLLIDFTHDQGAGEHCEMGARLFYSETVSAWLDTVLSK